MSAPIAAASRYHALDALRAAMMFLGIYLHAAVAYSPIGWMARYKPPQLTSDARLLDHPDPRFHGCRCSTSWPASSQPSCCSGTVRQRAIANLPFWRIVVPFVVGWIAIFPLAKGSWRPRLGAASIPRSTSSCWGASSATPIRCICGSWSSLIVFYGLAAIRRRGRFHASCHPACARGCSASFRTVGQTIWAPLPFGALSFLALLPMKYAGLDDPPGFVPARRTSWPPTPSRSASAGCCSAQCRSARCPRAPAWLALHAIAVPAHRRPRLDVLLRRQGRGLLCARAVLALRQRCLILGITRPVPALAHYSACAQALSLRFLSYHITTVPTSAGHHAAQLDPAPACRCRRSPRSCLHLRRPSPCCCRSIAGVRPTVDRLRC